jgi:imidazoleglycerol-phosphate dehydratase
MKTAFLLYEGFSALDFAALFDPLTRTGKAGHDWDVCAFSTDIYTAQGLHFYPTRITASLKGYDLVIIPGGPGACSQMEQPGLLAWLETARQADCIAAVNEGVLLLAAAGLAGGRRVAAQPEDAVKITQMGAQPVLEAVVFDGPLATASSPVAALELAQVLSNRTALAPDSQPMLAGIPVTGAQDQPDTQDPSVAQTRRSTINRQTGETQVEVRLDLDGTGRREIDTGLPFLDHMLSQIAVHGLFDVYVQAKGDLHIDPHHTVEDVALTLGSAFQQALGERAGIVRMASADCPMDESLAWVAVDFSGRPYTVFQADWHGPAVGSLPVSLIAHFFESFALNARCNLHAAVRYGRDDHHQAEALFKALARALCAATRIDPRRAGQVPSSKGVLF